MRISKWILLTPFYLGLLIIFPTTAQTINPAQIEAIFVLDYAKGEEEFSAHIILNNNSAVAINDWSLGFTFQRVINSVFGATILQQIGDYYLIGADNNSKTIPANGSISFNLLGKYTIKNKDDAPAGYFLILKNNDGTLKKPFSIKGKFLLPKPDPIEVGEVIYNQNIKNNNTPIEGNAVIPSLTFKESRIVPLPFQITLKKDNFLLKSDTIIYVLQGNKDDLKVANYLTEMLKIATGYTLQVKQTDALTPTNNAIYLLTKRANIELGSEGYTLEVGSQNVIIQANSSAGLFYGVQSLRQLFPPQIFSHTLQSNTKWNIQGVSIKDYPRFPYRGILFDVVRHFFTVGEVKRLIDLMAMHKFNVLHLHLADDEGWRIEIKHYPELTAKGAWRGYDEILPPALGSGINRYGGFYTQEEMRDLINYAAIRQITIIPEIDMPGHARALIKSLPDLLLDPNDRSVYSSARAFHDNVLSPCLPATFEVVNTILSEIIDLFPSPIIHTGGDEIPQGVWEKSPACIALMKQLNFTSNLQLQNYFSKKLQNFLASKNKTMGGWEEMTGGGLLAPTPKPLLYAWLGSENGIKLADKGFDVILSPYQFVYLEMAASPDPDEPGEYWGGYVDTFKVYSYSPIPPNISKQSLEKIKGIEGGIWTEYMDQSRIDYMTFPKIAALSEVAWTKASRRNWQDFSSRLGHLHLPRLDYYGVLYRLPIPGFKITLGELFANVEFPGLTLRYSLDSSQPTNHSPQYTVPVKHVMDKVDVRSFRIAH